MITPEEMEGAVPAGLLVRFVAMFYDALILLALFFAGTAILLFATGGHALAPNNPFYELYLLTIAFLYLGGSWVLGGQTIGMRAFRIHCLDQEGRRMTWWQAVGRFVGGILMLVSGGLGLLWMLWEREGRTWSDLLSRTVMLRVPKRPASR